MAYTGAHTGAEVDDGVGVTKGAGTGLIAKTATGTGAKRTITGTADQITVTNGDGVSGNPTLALASAITTKLNGIEALADVTDATNVQAALASGGLVLSEAADHTATPTAGKGEIWVTNDATQKLMFTDDAGTDREVLTDTSGTTLSAKTTPIGADDVLIFDSAASDAPKTSPVSHFTSEVICIAVSDETTALTTGTAKVTFRMPWAMTLTAVRASVTTAPTGAALAVDINEGGVSILSTVITIDATEKTSTTAATAAVISDTALADDAEITIDIDTVGSSVAGAGLKVYMIGYR